MQIPKFKTLKDKILACSEDELVAMANGRALAYADSSRLEGLVIDQEAIAQQFLEDYRKLRQETQPC